MHLYEHQIATNASQQMIKVTEMVREDIERSGVREGIAVIFSPHTTAGFTINENADPDVVHDMLCGFEKVFPAEAKPVSDRGMDTGWGEGAEDYLYVISEGAGGESKRDHVRTFSCGLFPGGLR